MKFPGDKGTVKKRKGKKGKKKWIAIGICGVIVAAGAGIFIMNGLRSKSVSAGNMPAMNAAVEKGTISTSIESTGSLANSEAVDVDVPIGIEIDEVKVESGDTVNAGDVLATVDEASLNAELSNTQEAIEALDTEINEESSDSTTKKVYATVDGRVKKIYASSGDAVNSVMLENGALMLISLDGKMAVTFETTQAVSAGDDVDVVLADGTVKDGTVAKVSGTACTVTCTDYGTGYQEAVTVQDPDGNTLGAGNLEIHQELKVMETTGTVSSISVSENEKVYVDEKLFTLSGDFASAEYYSLVKERENLEEKLELLLNISQNNAITANTNGVITDINVSAGTVSSSSSSDGSSSSSSDSQSSSGMSGVSYNSQVHTTQGTSGTTAGFVTLGSTFVQSAATEEKTEIASDSDEAASNTESTNLRTTAAVTETAEPTETPTPEPTETPTPEPTETPADTTQISKINTINITAPVTGATPATAIDETAGYSSKITWKPNDKAFKELTVYAADITLTAKDGFYFDKGVAPVVKGAVVLGVEISADGCTVTFTATFPTTEKKSSQNSTSGGNENNQTTQGGNTSSSSGLTSSSGSGTDASSGMSSSGSTGSASASASDAASAAASSDSSSSSSSNSENTELVTAFGIAENENMELSVSVDELDILSIEVGQKAAITLDALEDETFEGEITSIDTNGSSSSGVTKYTTKITVAKNESMMSGMNASVSIIVEEKSDILLIPSLAVNEQGNKSVVYTQKDDSTGELSGEVEVETGVTDGNNIEITSGLNEGDTVYYSMPITTTDSSSSDTQEFNMGGGMMQGGGDMPSGGSMPSGDGASGGRGGMGGGGQ